MNGLFVFIFFVGLLKYLWDQNKSNMLIMLVNNVIASKFSTPSSDGGISKGVKQLDGSYHVDYMIGGQQYTLVIPPQKRKLKWDTAMAVIDGGGEIEITESLRPYAGPHANFLNMPYMSHHLHRGSSRITLINEGLVVRVIEK